MFTPSKPSSISLSYINNLYETSKLAKQHSKHSDLIDKIISVLHLKVYFFSKKWKNTECTELSFFPNTAGKCLGKQNVIS